MNECRREQYKLMYTKRLRYWLKQRLSWVLVPIRSGPLKGSWFGLFTGVRFLRGNYGKGEDTTIAQLIKPGDIVFDIGAHVGYITMLASHLVGTGRVLAFEPSPLNLAYLTRHVRINRLTNVEVFTTAVGLRKGQTSFDMTGRGSGRGRMTANVTNNQPQVQINSLDDMHDQGRLPDPNFIKMDVEGAEGDALRGAAKMLARSHPTILLSVHGPAAKQDCEALLRGLGYELSYIKPSTMIAKPARI